MLRALLVGRALSPLLILLPFLLTACRDSKDSLYVHLANQAPSRLALPEWRERLSTPLEDRLQVPPPGVLAHLAQDNARAGYSSVPWAAVITDELRGRYREALRTMPPRVRELVAKGLIAV